MAILTKQKEKWLSENSKELFLSIQEERIDNVQFTKYLGVQVDNNLNWKGHIKALSIKISRAIGFLKHAKNFLTQGTLKTLYSGIVEPHLDTFAQFGVNVAQLKRTTCKNFKIKQQGY